VHQSQLRSWVKELANDPQRAFPDQGQRHRSERAAGP
jgi:transposase-like protein